MQNTTPQNTPNKTAQQQPTITRGLFFLVRHQSHTHTHILDILRLIKNAIAGQPTHELGGGLTKAARGLNRAQCAEKCQMNETCDYRETITDP